MSYALVLGAGGATGIAWETGLLKGLLDHGLDLTRADLIVGTSAGAIVGAQVATGVRLDRLYERQTDGMTGGERPPHLGRLVEFLSGGGSLGAEAPPRVRPTREFLAWIGAQARAASTRFSEAARLAVIEKRLPVHEWPKQPLLITAVDTAGGSLVTWDRSSGVPLPVAVASSCALPWVYPPVTIKGRRYMDGGVCSTTNADLAAGHQLVVVVAPLRGLTGGPGAVAEEVAALRAGGSRVEMVGPDVEAIEAIGPNPLDPARRAAAARAGLAQAPAAAAALAGIRPLLPV